MHAFCGIIRFDNRVIARASIDNMLNSLVLWQPDHRAIWHENPTSLGQMTQINLPESKYEHLPSSKLAKNLVMVCDARIDNRDNLLKQFGICSGDRQTTPDSTLILLAYERWGQECPKHLLGNFVFAIYNKRTKEFFCARDHLGVRVLFFHHQPGRFFAFSTSIKGLTTLAEVPIEVNLTKAAYQLALTFPNPEQTFYKNILSLMPGHFLTVSSDGLVVNKYWEPSPDKKIRYKKHEDYIENFKDLFEKAVSRRLRSVHPIASHLSGGLDSSSVSAVAANLLKKKGKRLISFGSVPPIDFDGPRKKNWINDDRKAMQSVASFVGNIDFELVEQSDKSHFLEIRDFFDFFDAPFLNFFNTHWIIDIAKRARMRGAKTLLIGGGGNSTISYDGRSPPGVMRRFYHYLKRLRLNQSNKSSGLSKAPWMQYSALHTSLSNEKSFESTCKIFHPGHYTNFDLVKLHMRYPSYHSLFRCVFGLNHLDPTFDKEIVEFCLALPRRQYAQNRKTRLLIRQAMNSRLPTEVIWRKERGAQAAIWEKQFESCKNELEKEIEKIHGSSVLAKLFDSNRMRELIKAWPNLALPTLTRTQLYRYLIGRGVLLGQYVLWIESKSLAKNINI